MAAAVTALTTRQIADLWVAEGGNPRFAPLMAPLAKRESGGRPRINNKGLNRNGTVDWGLYQINDIWRRDPVVGPLFRSGAILTPEGNTRAAIHILSKQGPRAWATFKPGVDDRYLGGLPSGPLGTMAGRPASSSQPPPRAESAVKPTFTPDRSALLKQYLVSRGRPGALLGLAAGLSEQPTQPRAPPATRPPTQVAPQGNGSLLELFWRGPGTINVKNGERVGDNFVSGHETHVHAAAEPRQILQLAKLAQSMGLHVGENPAFGGVAPVHVTNSNHYASSLVGGRKVGRAIDVSGDPARLRSFAHRVAELYGVH